MPIHDRRRGWLRQTSVLLVCASLTAYFAYHAIRGKHGLEARSRLSERSMLLEREITSLEAARARLERDVKLLGTAPPDPDLVSELAFEILGFVEPGTLVLSNERQQPRRPLRAP
jgi:cell division protein FtsB